MSRFAWWEILTCKNYCIINADNHNLAWVEAEHLFICGSRKFSILQFIFTAKREARKVTAIIPILRSSKLMLS